VYVGDDGGMGGRRKKGIKEKIKEKLPRGIKNDDQHATRTDGAFVINSLSILI
jgi:hypothetical protein